MPDKDITRDGFRCADGRFYAQGRVERIEGSHLRRIFLPRLTAEANLLIRDRRDFVRGQLQHYGVDYDESAFSGNGTVLLKKMLQAGRCDKVPAHIEALRAEMHAEWLEQQSEEDLSGSPSLIMEKYFVDSSGKPDPAKTTKVIGIPYPWSSDYRTGQLRETADRISGLHHATGRGSTQTIYLGWDRDAVEQAAKNHAGREAKESQAKADSREAERTARHDKYLADAKKPKFGPRGPSPIGRYMIDCEEIEGNWPDLAGDMTLAIGITTKPGIYQASFDFGVITGFILLSANEDDLDDFCAEQEKHRDYYGTDSSGDDDEEEDDEDDDDNEADEIEDEEEAAITVPGSKRKAVAAARTTTRGRPAKKAKAAGNPKKFFLRLKHRDTGTGEIHSTAEKGTINFGPPNLSSFTGQADMAGIGQGVVFTARKVSAMPPKLSDSWENYSQAAYERARVRRW